MIVRQGRKRQNCDPIFMEFPHFDGRRLSVNTAALLLILVNAPRFLGKAVANIV